MSPSGDEELSVDESALNDSSFTGLYDDSRPKSHDILPRYGLLACIKAWDIVKTLFLLVYFFICQ